MKESQTLDHNSDSSITNKRSALVWHSRTTVTVFFAIILMAMWAATGWGIARAKNNALVAAETMTQNLARVFTEHMISKLKRIEMIFSDLDRNWTPDHAQYITESDLLRAETNDLAFQIFLAEPSGYISYSSIALPAAPVCIADREYFTALLENPRRAIYISKPILGRVSGKWSIQFSKAIMRHNKLVGISVVSVDPDNFLHIFKSLGLESNDLIEIVRDDGILLARTMPNKKLHDTIITDTPYLGANTPVSGNFSRPSQIDGIERIFGFYKLPEYGLILIAAQSTYSAFTVYRQTRNILMLVVVSTSFVILMLAVLINSNLRHREQANQQLQLAANVFDKSGEAICITDMNMRILKVNKAFCRISGYNEEDVIGKTPDKFVSRRHGKEFYKKMWASITTQGWWQGEIWNRSKSGFDYLEWLSIKASYDSKGAPVNYMGIFSDIKKISGTQRRIEFLATHDELTSLPNRHVFNEQMQHTIKHCRMSDGRFAILFLDIDNFKIVNDSLGHFVGDDLLGELAQRLKKIVRPNDIVARFGGDEFAMLLYGAGTDKADKTAQEIIALLQHPFNVGGYEIYAAASIGICLYPDHGSDVNNLLKNADAAMYQAKEQGKNTYSFFTDQLHRNVSRQLDIEIGLPRAIERDELILHYQPQVDMMSRQAVGLEALVRWNHPVEGLIPPDQFISQAEKGKIIDSLGEWVTNAAVSQIAAWQKAGLNPPPVSINLSPSQFRRGEAQPMIERVLKRHQIPPHLLMIELTESALMADHKKIQRILMTFREMGLKIAIDDFGTGFSSLSSLRHYPINELKIDKTFVREVARNSDDRAITQTIIAMSNSLGLSVVAEGIETFEQHQTLVSLGCHVGQGYYFAKPLPPDELVALGFLPTMQKEKAV